MTEASRILAVENSPFGADKQVYFGLEVGHSKFPLLFAYFLEKSLFPLATRVVTRISLLGIDQRSFVSGILDLSTPCRLISFRIDNKSILLVRFFIVRKWYVSRSMKIFNFCSYG